MTKSKTYEEFVEKFKPKLTTDDCYTPPEIYDVVAEWVTERYGVDREDMVRPFYPGGDYERFDYPDGCCVVDNPPFSIISKIQRFYLDNGVPFFLFAPTLTALSGVSVCMDVCHVICDAKITYENGAVVPTSFVTNMVGDVVAESEPELSARINDINDMLLRQRTRQLPKYEYPDHVITAAKLTTPSAKYAGSASRYMSATPSAMQRAARVRALIVWMPCTS